MPTISLGRVLPVDKGTWVSGAKYIKQDITDYNNKTYYISNRPWYNCIFHSRIFNK